MVTHTQNLCSAFNPSKCTHTVANTHTHTHTLWTHTRSSGQPMLWHPGSSWGFGALLKGLISAVVLRVESALYILTPPTNNSCRTWDSNPWPSGYKSDSLSIRPWLPPLYIKKTKTIANNDEWQCNCDSPSLHRWPGRGQPPRQLPPSHR